jgi:hypothetical protein
LLEEAVLAGVLPLLVCFSCFSDLFVMIEVSKRVSSEQRWAGSDRQKAKQERGTKGGREGKSESMLIHYIKY